jgi:hypothetical protein
MTEDRLAEEFWEPWKPAIGQRVRYRYQPECPGVYGLLPFIAHTQAGHPPEYDGLKGYVAEARTEWGSHPYLVRLDQGSLTRSICAAALELEPDDRG